MAILNLKKQSRDGSWSALFEAKGEKGPSGKWYFSGDIVHVHLQTPAHWDALVGALVSAGVGALANPYAGLYVAINWAITCNPDGTRDFYIIKGMRVVKIRILWWTRWKPIPIVFQGFVPSHRLPPVRTDLVSPGVIIPATPRAIFRIQQIKAVANLFRNKP